MTKSTVPTPTSPASKATRFFLVALGIVLLDQIVKLLVKFNMTMGREGEIHILGELFKLHFIENPGAAFGTTVDGIFSMVGLEITPYTGKLILSIFSLIALGAIGYVLFRLRDHKSPLPWFVAMIFGGATGNIVDRTFYGVWFSEMNTYEGGLFHGRVVDMFFIDIWEGIVPNWVPILGGEYYSLWPIWNIADASISIGIVVILIFQGKFFKMDEQRTAATAPAAVETPATEPKAQPEIPSTDTPETSPN